MQYCILNNFQMILFSNGFIFEWFENCLTLLKVFFELYWNLRLVNALQLLVFEFILV